MDIRPAFKKSLFGRITASAILVTPFIIGGLPFCTQGGYYLLTFFDNCVGGWQIMSIAAFEFVCLAGFYGWDRFRQVLGAMVPWFIKCRPLSAMYGIFFRFIAPVVTALLCVAQFINDVPLVSRGYHYPYWSLVMSHTLRVSNLSPLFIYAGYCLYKYRGNLKAAFRPIAHWQVRNLPAATSIASLKIDA